MPTSCWALSPRSSPSAQSQQLQQHRPVLGQFKLFYPIFTLCTPQGAGGGTGRVSRQVLPLGLFGFLFCFLLAAASGRGQPDPGALQRGPAAPCARNKSWGLALAPAGHGAGTLPLLALCTWDGGRALRRERGPPRALNLPGCSCPLLPGTLWGFVPGVGSSGAPRHHQPALTRRARPASQLPGGGFIKADANYLT